MIRLANILNEDVGEEAKRRGLHHIGFGRYADKSGNLVAKSQDGRLVDIPKGEKDPTVDLPSGDIEDMPSDKRPDAWKDWKPRRSAEDDDLRPYRSASGTSSGMMGSEWEKRYRRLPPGDITIDKNSNNPYVARNPDGKLAAFSNDTIAAAFSQGKTLKGYDFDKDYEGSMEKLKKELKPIMDKFEKEGKKGKFKAFVKDLVAAFVQGASRGTSFKKIAKGMKIAKTIKSRRSRRKSNNDFGGFGGGGGFSGGGSSRRF
jgi:hypothetical protein